MRLRMATALHTARLKEAVQHTERKHSGGNGPSRDNGGRGTSIPGPTSPLKRSVSGEGGTGRCCGLEGSFRCAVITARFAAPQRRPDFFRPSAFLGVSREPVARVRDGEADDGKSPVCFEGRTGYTGRNCGIDLGDSPDDDNEECMIRFLVLSSFFFRKRIFK